MRILVLNSEIPFPPVTGAQSRTYHLLRGLSTDHDVTLVGFSWNSHDSPTICSLPVEVICVPWAPSEPYRKMYEGSPSMSQAAYRHLAYKSAEPWFVSYYDSAAMESLLAELMSRSFDLILIEHSFMARFLPFLRPDVPKVLDMHNVHTLMAWRRAQEKSGSEKDDAVKEFERTQSFERTVCSACQLCLCCSGQDAEAARHFLNIEHLRVIPNGVDTAMMTTGKAPITPGYLLFTGMMNYKPNLEAVRYFVGDILPLIRDKVPYAHSTLPGQILHRRSRHSGPTACTSMLLCPTCARTFTKPLSWSCRCSTAAARDLRSWMPQPAANLLCPPRWELRGSISWTVEIFYSQTRLLDLLTPSSDSCPILTARLNCRDGHAGPQKLMTGPTSLLNSVVS